MSLLQKKQNIYSEYENKVIFNLYSDLNAYLEWDNIYLTL